jgi:hypothetical protein
VLKKKRKRNVENHNNTSTIISIMVSKRIKNQNLQRDRITQSLGFTGAIFVAYLIFLQLLNIDAVGQLQSRLWGVSSEHNMLLGFVIVAVECLALPYFLIVGKSSLIRCLSAIAAASVFFYWMVIGIVTVISHEIVNVGLMGKLLPLPGGEWFLLLMIGMLGIVLLYEMLVQKWHLPPLEKTHSK